MAAMANDGFIYYHGSGICGLFVYVTGLTIVHVLIRSKKSTSPSKTVDPYKFVISALRLTHIGLLRRKLDTVSENTQ